jgi:hypothetical protein
MARIDSLLFPAFAGSAGLRLLKFGGQKSFVFIILLKAQPLACGRDEGKLAGKTDGLGREGIRA